MSGPEPRDALRLARELADFPGAVPVLVALFHNGGSARREVLTAATDPRHVDDALRWLAAGRLISRSAGSGTLDLDQAGTSYELTVIGSSLTGSLIELAKVFNEPATSPEQKATMPCS